MDLHDLHIMLVEIKADVKYVREKQDESVMWQKDHEEKDAARFKEVNKYGASIAVVSSFIGAGFIYLWDYLKKQV